MAGWKRNDFNLSRPAEETMDEKKVSAAQRKATNKYLEKFDEIRTRVPKGRKEIIQAHAEAQGESVNGFINRAIDETMERDGEAAE